MTSISGMISNASEYVKEGLVSAWQRWVVLIVLSIIQTFTLSLIPLMSGYLVRVYGSSSEIAPDVNDFGRLFIDGWKINFIAILYIIPAVVIAIIFGVLGFVPLIFGVLEGAPLVEVIGLFLGSIGVVIAIIIFVLITLIMNMAFVHFARTGKFFEAFSVGDIFRKISEGVGFGTYFIVWIIVWIMMVTLFLIVLGLALIPFIGWLVGPVLTPLWVVFIAKIYCNLYDNFP